MTTFPSRFFLKVFTAHGSERRNDGGDWSTRSPENIAVFQRWIRDEVLPGTWIDVADYGHVAGGPGVLLAGHEANLMTDDGELGPGLLLQVQRGHSLAAAVSLLRRAADALVSAEYLHIKPIFAANRILIGANDRLRFPATTEGMNAWKHVVSNEIARCGVAARALEEAWNPGERPCVIATLAV